MEGIIRYCVVKKQKGVLKRSILYTHLLFVPVDPNQYMYLALVSQMTEEDNANATQWLVNLSNEIMEDTLKGEQEHFGKKFVEVEALKCKSFNPSPLAFAQNSPKNHIGICSIISENTVKQHTFMLILLSFGIRRR